MDFRVLGPVGVIADGGVAVDIGPYQQRLVLAMCVLSAPRPVGPNRMIDALWEGDPPPGALNTVQAYVSKLRRVFEPGRPREVPPKVLTSRPGGYVLDVPETAIDLGRVRGHVAGGRSLGAAGDHEGAVRELRLALGEWSGDPLEDLPGSSWAAEESAHLVELRLTIEEDLAEAELALGRGASVTAGLAKLVGAHPFRERLRALAAHALYQAGRQADALGLLAEGRRVLMEDLGLDPDPWSREMERRILGQDPELRPRRTAEVGAAAGAADAGKTAAVTEAANTEAANTAEKAGTAETTGAGEAAAEPAGQEKGTGLVGRGAEAGVLARAVSGDGHRVVLLAGEPGIGKTSLAEHAADVARARGRRVVWGRCWDGTGAPPYWPWTQAVQDLVGRDGELAQLARAGTGTGAGTETGQIEGGTGTGSGAGQAGGGQIGRIGTEGWAERTGQAGQRGQSGRFALYEAFARLLNEHGRVLVVLDDLQWADTSSLRLLEFLASTRLCPELTVVATYRDTDVRPGEPLEHTLGVLRRLPHVRRLLLRGLADEEIREYLGRAGADPGRAAEMGRLTAGNPFFLGEVLQLGETPEALSDVVRGRMAHLPPDTEEVLTVAALLGREAATDILTRVAELPEGRVLDIVDAAVGARLLVEGEGPSCRFVHDIVRDVLREALPPLRRRRLHARIAEVLEERNGTRLTEIAHHYREGLLTPAMAGRAIGYTRRAAAQATAQFAHEDAAESLERAIAMIDWLPGPDNGLRCDLLLDLAEAQAAAGMSGAARASLEATAQLAEELGDDNRLARAVLGFSNPIYLAMYEEMTGIDRLAGRIDRVLASDLAGDSPWRAQLLAAAALTGSTLRPVEQSVQMAEEAVRLARRTGEDQTLSRTLIALEILLRSGHDHDHRRAVVAEIVDIGRRTGDLATEWIGRESEYVELNAQGAAGPAAESLAWLRESAERLRLPSMVSLAAWQRAVHAYLAGRFADALAEADASGTAHPEGALGRGDALLRRETFRFLSLRAAGEAGEALALSGEMLAHRPGQSPWRILRCLALIDLGRTDEAREAFAELARDGFAALGPELAYRFVPDAVSEICAALGDEAAGKVLYRRLAPNTGRLLGWSLTDLCLARLALLDGDEERAGAHLRAAEAFAAAAGLRVYEPALRALAGALRPT
ncbi:AAA family ATPase [Streptosporangium sp. NBC_01755]|uniref:BTAD domain-containing putative transcriptional regulator n=1 Tax=Streptosporangium sp. NBC_01755 TaxID=2975949 RepID=UPI002DDA58A9|nr:BTAD domain-containing putative transcriptional regulator [Streptosporangium sp. NBC_01755]WSC97968.1 AAA family ATPase [Streptosporangium sp. NBC_01755]